MKKKTAKKRTATKSTRASSGVFIRFVSISLGVLFVAFIGIAAIQNTSGTNVLGTNTKAPLLADQGESDQVGNTAPTSAGQQPPSHPPGDRGHTTDTQQGPSPHSIDQYNIKTPGKETGLNGEGTVTGYKADGAEGQNGLLKKMNEELKGKNIEVGSSSANSFTIKSGKVEAETHFPLSVNPTTNTLTITTPAGTKDVTVLPDQAVNNLLRHNIISKVSSSSGQATTGGTSVETVTLTQINNQPAFAVQGVSDKKLLGIFPVSLPKTVYVSAQTGQVIQTQESFFNQILSALSL